MPQEVKLEKLKYDYFNDFIYNEPPIDIFRKPPKKKLNLKPIPLPVENIENDDKLKDEIEDLNKKDISNEEIENLKMDWKFINRVGIELEGAWLEERNDLHEDLSFGRGDFDYKYKSVGEYTSKPLEDSVKLFKCIRDNYPDYAKPLHNSCAFHIHFSLKSPALYAVCMNREFYREFLDAIIKWGESYPCKNEEFWHRVDGENRYCRKNFMPDFQASFSEKGRNRETRRTQLNYCYKHLGTIECRLFPVFNDCKTAIYATHALLNFVEDYLSKNQLKELEAVDKVENVAKENRDTYEKVNLESQNKRNKPFKKFNFFSENQPEFNIREIRDTVPF